MDVIPEITPVDVFKKSPGGKDPEMRAKLWLVPCVEVTEIAEEYSLPTTLGGREEVTM